MGIVPFLRHVLSPPAIVGGSEALPSTKPVCALFTFEESSVSQVYYLLSSHLTSKFMAQLACAPLSALSLV